jgi:hypothetical protein
VTSLSLAYVLGIISNVSGSLYRSFPLLSFSPRTKNADVAVGISDKVAPNPTTNDDVRFGFHYAVRRCHSRREVSFFVRHIPSHIFAHRFLCIVHILLAQSSVINSLDKQMIEIHRTRHYDNSHLVPLLCGISGNPSTPDCGTYSLIVAGKGRCDYSRQGPERLFNLTLPTDASGRLADSPTSSVDH